MQEQDGEDDIVVGQEVGGWNDRIGIKAGFSTVMFTDFLPTKIYLAHIYGYSTFLIDWKCIMFWQIWEYKNSLCDCELSNQHQLSSTNWQNLLIKSKLVWYELGQG